VDAITKSLAKELGPRNIRVNAISPGMVETEGTHSAGIIESDFQKQVEAQTPLGRIGQPKDIAAAAVFLLLRMLTGSTARSWSSPAAFGEEFRHVTQCRPLSREVEKERRSRRAPVDLAA
jgi:NAD(P)-dependent dehydrogenase (short-subunit alcohol dehydrogenase family)